MAYPITYECAFEEDRSRVTTFFRYLLAIPHFFVAALFGLAASVAIIVAWFSIVFTGRYPEGLYNFNAGFLRYVARLNGYISLATDRYPPFGLGESPDYPVQLHVAPVQPEYNRMKTLFRIILAIPVYIIAYALQIVTLVAAVISWFWIVIAGKQNDGLHAAINLGLSYSMKAYGYYFLLTETWPPFSDDASALPVGGQPASTLTAATAAPPAAPEAPSMRGSDIGLPDAPPSSPPPSTPGMSSGDPLG